jgi:hypothetical protein
VKSRFRVTGTFDLAGGAQVATVEIDRVSGIVSVRPLRRRRTYSLPLASVAAWICQSIIHAELRERRHARPAQRRTR